MWGPEERNNIALTVGHELPKFIELNYCNKLYIRPVNQPAFSTPPSYPSQPPASQPAAAPYPNVQRERVETNVSANDSCVQIQVLLYSLFVFFTWPRSLVLHLLLLADGSCDVSREGIEFSVSHILISNASFVSSTRTRNNNNNYL